MTLPFRLRSRSEFYDVTIMLNFMIPLCCFSLEFYRLCTVCICKFTHLVKFIHDPRISTHGTFAVVHGHARVQRGEKCKRPHLHVPRWGQQGHTLLLFSAIILQTSVHFVVYLSAMFFTFLSIFLVTSFPVSMAPKYSAAVASNVPECGKAGHALQRKCLH